MNPIVANKYPIEPPQVDNLRTLFESPAYTTLKEIIVAHCVHAQVQFMNCSLYNNDNATVQAMEHQTQAARFNNALDVLDDLEGKMEEWFRIKLETR